MDDLRTQYRDSEPKSGSSSDGDIAAPPPTLNVSPNRQPANQGQAQSWVPQPANTNTDRLRKHVEDVETNGLTTVNDKLDQILAQLLDLKAGKSPALAAAAAESVKNSGQFLTPQDRAEAERLREQDVVQESDSVAAAVNNVELARLKEKLSESQKEAKKAIWTSEVFERRLKKVTQERDNAKAQIAAHDKADEEATARWTAQVEDLNTQLEQTQAKLENTIHELNETEQELLEEKERTQRAEERRRVLFDEVQEVKGNIRVMCRVRPAPEDTPEEELLDFGEPEPGEFNDEWGRLTLHTTRKAALGDVKEARKFEFERVFGQDATNDDVFGEISELVQSAMYGKKVTCFCYGQTGSGKTHTMMGTPDDRGIIPKTIQMLFDAADEQVYTFAHTIKISVIEIYQDTIHDLLQYPLGGQKVVVRNRNQAVQTVIANVSEATDLLSQASQYRATASTNMNEQSSRSHLIITFQITRGPGLNLDGPTITGTLNLIDLAGSERTASGGATGTQMREGVAINSDLLGLNKVITALAAGTHVTYDSALTKTLRDSLSEGCRALMFVMVSPFSRDQTQTVQTLDKGAEATKAKINSLGRGNRKSLGSRPTSIPSRTSTSTTTNPASQTPRRDTNASLLRPSSSRRSIASSSGVSTPPNSSRSNAILTPSSSRRSPLRPSSSTSEPSGASIGLSPRIAPKSASSPRSRP